MNLTFETARSWFLDRIVDVPAKKVINVVCTILEDSSGGVFVAKRPEGKSLGGYWEFPGGKIEDGETPQAALAREIREELNVFIEIGDGLPASEFVYEFGTVVLHPFRAKIESGEIRLNEHVEGKWVQVAELEKLRLAPADIPIARGLVSE
jgi:8-oxo-dGTP diphosphatase